MTIPQGDSRGATSVSERRKVTFEGDHPTVGQQHSTATAPTTTPSTSIATTSTTTTTFTSTSKTSHATAGSLAFALTSSASSDSSTASSQLTTSASTTAASGTSSFGAGTHSVNPAYDLTPDQDLGALTLPQGCCTSASPVQFSYHPTDGDTSLPRLHTSLDSYTKSQEDDKRLKQHANQLLNAVCAGDSANPNACKSTFSVPFQDLQKSPLPLLNFFIPDDSLHSSSFSSSVSSFSDRSRKVSLNLPRPNKSQLLDAESTDRVRRYSQPQKSAYQRVPLDDPSPTHNRFSSDFTLSSQAGCAVGETDQNLRQQPQTVETHSHNAQVHATFGNTQDTSFGGTTCPVSTSHTTVQAESESNPTDTLSTKRVFFRKQRAPTQSGESNSSSNPTKSLDDLTAKRQGLTRSGTRTTFAGPNRPLFLSTSSRDTKFSASTENISLSFRRRQHTLGGGGAAGGTRRDHAHHHHHHPPPSPGSPSRCCLVSVSRVPMAAATSHLTLDSDYQTVRLAVLGAPGVGKSSIVRQFVMQQFPEEYVPTEQRQVFCPAVIINEHLYEVRIIDCPYIPYFPVNSLYEWTDFRGYGLRNATAYVLVYDITSEDSFEVANMVKKQWKCGYIECSAKFNWHIMLLFKELMKSIDYIDYGHKPTSMRVQDALRRNRCVIL
ncbi:Ras-like GTP-binding protein Rho1 [Elysia marginata]|uniref:Ras-like GTP-binding protein Rho1 n=1 Tax=Elysia marginata TaxID=1093978 RepID=A0AAV4IYQ1_9GAST|nr:Ras-like GTP-binding protein Rho1 [Elysia marginata]